MTTDLAVDTEAITKRYGDLVAVDDVSLRVFGRTGRSPSSPLVLSMPGS